MYDSNLTNKLFSGELNREQRESEDLLRVSLPHLTASDGDTIIIIDFPPPNARNCDGYTWENSQFRMSSEVLRNTNSSAIIAGLSDENQCRYRRRHKDRLASIQPEFNYVLDLTPSIEGEEAAFLVGELSLPAGVRNWWMAHERLCVSEALVSGHDDRCHHHEQIPDNCIKDSEWKSENFPRDKGADAQKYRITLGLEHCLSCEAREMLDYCDIRHRANIIRLMLAVAGHDLVLNSAPRVYTIVALAKQLDLVNFVVSPVRLWLEDHRNSNFIDIHPEIALEMAWKLQLSDLARASLRILVVERALEPADSSISKLTRLGRPRAGLSDDISTVVEHATASLRVRCKEAAEALFSRDPLSWFGIPSWELFMQTSASLEAEVSATGRFHPGHSAAREIYELHQQVCLHLRKYIDQAIGIAYDAVRDCGPPHATRRLEIDNDRLAYVQGGSAFQDVKQVMGAMSKEEILLMPFFWSTLMTEIAHYQSFHDYNSLGYMMDQLNQLLRGASEDGLFPGLQNIHNAGTLFDLHDLHEQLFACVSKLFNDWVPYYGNLEVPLHRTTHLALGFTEDEFKYLPLWAGGLDDGTGGVFNDMVVPDTDMGPNQPGPAYITGKTIAPSSIANSDVTIIGGGMSVQAAQDTNGSMSKTSDSFVQVSSWASDNSRGYAGTHSEIRHLRNVMGGMHIYSDSSTTSLRNAMDGMGVISNLSEFDDIDYSNNHVEVNDARSLSVDSGDDIRSLVTDSMDITDDEDHEEDYNSINAQSEGESDWVDVIH